ncbi:MAG: ABC transporter substrate-binding protein [Thermodesulforhabdaceae bacterium]|jgi:branched-chain amino acid transport system substrate-binding protein
MMLKQVFFGITFIILNVIANISFCEQIVSIGSINPLTGKLAQHGLEVDQGIRIAIEEANSEEQGIKFKLIRRDDKSLPEDAMNQAEQLILQDKVVALVGGYVDTLVGPIATVARKHEVPYVASASLESRLTETPNPFFFRISHINGVASPLVGFLKEKAKPRRLALAYASTPGAMELAEKIRNGLSGSNISIVLDEKLRPGTPDFSPFLLKCKAKQADFIISALFLPDHLILVRQLQDLKIPVKGYLGPWGIAYAGFVKEMGDKAEGLYGMLAWSPKIFPQEAEKISATFTERYQHAFGTEPTSTAMHGYVSARVVIDAVRRMVESGRPVSAKELADFIKTTDMISPLGRIAFDDHGNPRYYSQFVVQIQKGGSFTVVYPPR